MTSITNHNLSAANLGAPTVARKENLHALYTYCAPFNSGPHCSDVVPMTLASTASKHGIKQNIPGDATSQKLEDKQRTHRLKLDSLILHTIPYRQMDGLQNKKFLMAQGEDSRGNMAHHLQN